VATDVGPRRRRIQDRDAGPHPRRVDAVAQEGGSVGKLHPIVYAHHLVRIVTQRGGHDVAVSGEQADDVGEVLLALRVVGCEATEAVREAGSRECVHAGVDLVNATLLLRCVLLLDDRRDRAVTPPVDAPVAGRIREPGGQDRGRRGGRLVLDQEAEERAASQQRRVATQHDDRAVGDRYPALGQIV
jgi:hypothetical protein